MKSNPKFIISGGGTGGHIYPAIAIAKELQLQFPNAEFLFVGAQDKMEMQKVPAAGFAIEGLWIAGLQRSLTLKNAMFPLKFISSLWRSRSIIKKFNPDVVIGTGGFASGTVVKVAADMGIPTIVQEQNSYPGLTNKMLAKKAKAICVAYDGLEKFFPADKIIKTGNPVRSDLLHVENLRDEAITYFKLNPNKKVLAVMGGSLGAKRINELIFKNKEYFNSQNIQVLWQCGKGYYQQYSNEGDDTIKVLDYIERMDLFYAAADVIVSRAGASSVSELAIVGKPVIFIPSPNVAEDHQTKNANSIVMKNGAVMIKESQLDKQFTEQLNRILSQPQVAEALAKNIKQMAMPNATKEIVEVIKKWM